VNLAGSKQHTIPTTAQITRNASAPTFTMDLEERLSLTLGRCLPCICYEFSIALGGQHLHVRHAGHTRPGGWKATSETVVFKGPATAMAHSGSTLPICFTAVLASAGWVEKLTS
jgi:hypothetical protein